MLEGLAKLFRQEWERRLAVANHRSVAKQVYTESRTTAGYFLLLTLANLIALCGLLANSVPVIIGAMLISPLMGPILSFGFGFITGDTVVLRQAVRKIGFSIVLTLAVAALASYVSPLQIATTEILSRTKPNLFDLLVAIFAGTAGAGALCTKRSVLTIIPGVAIATAVIPPLSVSGYGLGTGQWFIFWGGFFLFFTNFIAITIVTCLVFLSYGFKPGETVAAPPGTVRNRMVVLTAVLLVISVPLVLTLQSSIVELRDRRTIRAVLQEAFNQERHSNIAAFSQRTLEDGTVAVNAVLNTIEYRSQKEVAEAEDRLATRLGRPANLYLEQIKTLPGGAVPDASPAVRLRSPAEVLSTAREDSRGILEKALRKLAGLLAPSKLAGSSITFGQGDPPISVQLEIRRDMPLSPDEQGWLERYLSAELQQPVRLEVELLPLLEPLEFLPGETALTPEHEARLQEAGRLCEAGAGPLLQIESQPESARSLKAARVRLDTARQYLTEACSVPADRLKATVAKRTSPEPRLVLRFVPSPEAKGRRGAVSSPEE